VFSWRKEFVGGYDNVFAQRVSPGGEILWPENGIPISADPSSRVGVKMVPSDKDNKLFVFLDYRNQGSDLYAQKLDTSGNRVWEQDMPVYLG
jgi:hypothetical protein